MTAVCLIAALVIAVKSEYVISDKWTTVAVNSTPLETNDWHRRAVTATSSALKNNECAKVMTLPPAQRCEFVLNTTDCHVECGFINYSWVTFCLFPPKLLPLAIFIYVLWLLILFLVLGLIASEFFCPNLSAISSTLRLTHNVAGVTFLALGNGAPDVFSAMAAFSRPQTAGLAIGALFEEEFEPLISSNESTSRVFLRSINPLDSRSWRRMHWGWKVLKIIQLPFEVMLLLTVPVVDTDKKEHNWKRPLNCLHLITGPLVCVLTFNSGTYGLYLIDGEFPVWMLIALVGAFLSGIVYCSTINEHRPLYHFLFSLLGFIVSALWINTVASEVVGVLHLLGIVLHLSNTVLGLTLLAWGNSIGDCFADITIARQGYPRMAISACFGGIIFNMLFGVGLGCLLQMFKHRNFIMLESEGLLCWVLAAALGLSLVFSFVLVPLQCFHLSRAYGIFLLLFYVAFLIIALLTEFGKIQM
ncbi:mitochondrial sodium/calcium exchanger protein isoform X5 [Neoarius graeffei]|uniref:mitochondrial sodium/calcium exchanger protein isoform X5 n=1 Tax=Neoarius graeffei TaxID=443677 RepID=UPI00298BE0B9|nr:mitochondrial sodium/calcium exchanger protein isoform X5 [Neoarius graeffei]